MAFLDTLKRLLRHTAFSLFGTATDMIVLWVFSHFVLEGSYVGEYIISPMISFECATIVNFLVSSNFVWGDRMKGTGVKSYLKHFIGFNASYVGVFFVKMGLLLLLELASGWDVVWCNLIAVTLCGFINFFMNEKIIFRKRK